MDTGAVLDEEAAEEVLPAAGLVTASADYYPTVAINALMRTLRDPAMAPHHSDVVRALFSIFQALGLSSVPYLPKVTTLLSPSRHCTSLLNFCVTCACTHQRLPPFILSSRKGCRGYHGL